MLVGRTSKSLARGHHPVLSCRLIVGTLFVLSLAGCTSSPRYSLSSLWQPPERWYLKRSESHSIAGDDEHKAEPAVAANVALEIETGDAPRSKPTVPSEERAKPLLANILNRHPLTDGRQPTSNEVIPQTGVEKARPDHFANREQVNSPMDRLNAALTDDSIDSPALPQPSLTNLEERNQVKRMLDQANKLLGMGQFEQARQTARKALELGDSAQLDYSPDEERPIDLVRRIESQIESIEQPNPESALTALPISKETDTADGPNSPEGLSKPPTKDPSSLSRIRRDISTLFRRGGGKKPTGFESDTVEQTSSIVQSASESSEPKPLPKGGSTSSSKKSDAIVLANRSVTLGPLESIGSSDQRDDLADSSDVLESVFDDQQSPVVIMPVPDGQGNLADVDSASDLQMPRAPRRVDDPSIGQPDLDVSETAATFQEPLAKGVPQSVNSDESSAEPRRDADWTWCYVCIAISAGLALYLYRRGTN